MLIFTGVDGRDANGGGVVVVVPDDPQAHIVIRTAITATIFRTGPC